MSNGHIWFVSKFYLDKKLKAELTNDIAELEKILNDKKTTLFKMMLKGC